MRFLGKSVKDFGNGRKRHEYSFAVDDNSYRKIGEALARVAKLGDFKEGNLRGYSDMDIHENELWLKSADDIEKNLDFIEKIEPDNGYVEIDIDGDWVQIEYHGDSMKCSGMNKDKVRMVATELKEF